MRPFDKSEWSETSDCSTGTLVVMPGLDQLGPGIPSKWRWFPRAHQFSL